MKNNSWYNRMYQWIIAFFTRKRLYKSTGILKYNQELENCKLILQIDQGIYDFYYSLIPKCLYAQRQMYSAHISVVRKEIPPNLDKWGKYENETITFYYENKIHFNSTYLWLNCFSTQLEKIRTELGLEITSSYTMPPDGFNKCFHITLANFKNYVR
jgi:hypothetical protein